MIEPSAALSSSTRRVVLAAIAALSSPMLLTPAPALAAGTAESSEQLHFVVLLPGDRGSTINGSTDDWRRARSFRTGSEGLVYVRLHGVDYVIRDASMLRRAESIFEPQAKLGERQAALGQQQAALGARQGELGAKQGRIGADQANAVPQQTAELGRQQAELGRQQAALGEQQAALGARQGELGREQGRLAQQAEASLRALVVEAIQRGLAQRVN